MSHTPGPWVVDVERKSKRSPATMLMVVAEKGGMPGLIVNQPPVVTDADWANACLIAAAPDLLAACEEFVRKVEAGEASSTRSYRQMKDVIKKAKGEA